MRVECLSEVDADQIRATQSRITSGHQLLRIADKCRGGLYSNLELHRCSTAISPYVVIDKLIPALRLQWNARVTSRVNAAISRTRKALSVSASDAVPAHEYAIEALADTHSFRSRDFMSRSELRRIVLSAAENGRPIRMILPLFSRKPLSPFKNRGTNPDLAEIASLLYLARAAQVVNLLSTTGCELRILADGNKYSRGCDTPRELICRYQDSLRYWVRILEIEDVVKIDDYENFLENAHDADTLNIRAELYEENCTQLRNYVKGSYGDNRDWSKIREQLGYTFLSIAMSRSFACTGASEQRFATCRAYDDEMRAVYFEFASGIQRKIEQHSGEEGYDWLAYEALASERPLISEMWTEAIDAAVNYVSISMTDRSLRLVPRATHDCLKLTIHAKPGELLVTTAPRDSGALVAQHATGGLHVSGSTLDFNFKYRLQREYDYEVPVLIDSVPDDDMHRLLFGPLIDMNRESQPLFYLARNVAEDRIFYSWLA